MSEETKQLLQEVELFLQYGVDAKDLHGAAVLVRSYQNDALVLRLLREYYLNLPEAREEAVMKIAELKAHQGVQLFVLVCTGHSYLYLVSAEHQLFLGEYQQEISGEVLSFFGYSNMQEFLQSAVAAEKLVEYREQNREDSYCPACGVAVGEFHVVGCIVEVCPWCDGQLSSCNCRFEQLETDEIEDEKQLESFIDLLSAKGRIPYRRTHTPAYPGTSEGLDNV